MKERLRYDPPMFITSEYVRYELENPSEVSSEDLKMSAQSPKVTDQQFKKKIKMFSFLWRSCFLFGRKNRVSENLSSYFSHVNK